MQIMANGHKKQLILFLLLPLVSSCSGDNRRIKADKEPLLELITKIEEIDDQSHFLVYFDGEDHLEQTSCKETDGVFLCHHHNKVYSNRSKDGETLLPYDGETKEGFIKECFALDAPTSYFSYNDLLPHFKAIASGSEEYYYRHDHPKSTFEVLFDKETDGCNDFLHFLEGKTPKTFYNDFLSVNEYSLWIAHADSLAPSFNLYKADGENLTLAFSLDN